MRFPSATAESKYMPEIVFNLSPVISKTCTPTDMLVGCMQQAATRVWRPSRLFFTCGADVDTPCCSKFHFVELLFTEKFASIRCVSLKHDALLCAVQVQATATWWVCLAASTRPTSTSCRRQT